MDEQTLRSEFAAFLNGYTETVANLSEADLNRYKQSVLSNLQETPKNLGELNSRFMESVGLGYRDFDFREQLAEQVSEVTLSSLNAAYQAVMVGDIRALSVASAESDKKNTAIDLREEGDLYQYRF